MFPRLFQIGSFALHTYGVLLAIGYLLGIYTAQRFGRRFGLDPEQVFNLSVYLALAAILGAKLFLLFQDWRRYIHAPLSLFSMEFVQSAGIFYGGVVMALLVLVWYVRKYNMNWLRVGDAMVPGVAIGHAIGRLGCFSAGCCWGKEAHVPWAVVFRNPYATATTGVPLNIPLHPTQLYESACEFLIFGALVWLARRRSFEGQLFATYLLAYGIVRYIVDFFRYYEPQALLFHGMLTVGQLTSLFLIALAIAIWASQHRAPVRQAAVTGR
jgi:phosphatidylglycerol:prolipoprotein diacylglycerol transferase